MNPLFTLILGLLIGWLIEWLIDVFYWRRRYKEKATQYSDNTAAVTSISSLDNYDFFKTLVTSLLATTLILMLVAGFATYVVLSPAAETLSSPNSTEVIPTFPPLTETALAANLTYTIDPSPVSPAIITPTVDSIATASSKIVPEQATSTQAQVTCNTSVPSRLNVGQAARVIQRLRMRSVASIDASLIQINPPNTEVEIIGGPVCTPVGERAYLWWQIRLADGAEGWSVEAQLNEASYFLEPIP